MTFPGNRPTWLTFDCYGTLIQWDEGLLAAMDAILRVSSAEAMRKAISVSKRCMVVERACASAL